MTCSKCHPTYDLGRICPHQGPGLLVYERGYDQGRAEVAVVLIDLIAQLREHCREPSCNCDIGQAADYAETRLRRLRDD